MIPRMLGGTIAKPPGIVKCGLTTAKRCPYRRSAAPTGSYTVARSDRRREPTRPAVFADRHIGKNRLGHLPRFVGRQVPPPGFDANGHRGAPRSDKLAIAADLVPDDNRLVKDDGVDGHRGTPPARSLGRETAPGEIHLRQQPPAKD